MSPLRNMTIPVRLSHTLLDHFLILKLIHVNLLSSSKQKVLTNCVEGNDWYTTIPHLFNDMVPYGFITSQDNTKSHFIAQRLTPKSLAR